MEHYFTTPIYYVNAAPHIGTAYTTLAADTLARYWRKKLGREYVRFTTGTDENSQKTLSAAAAKGQSVEEYLSEMADEFVDCWGQLGIDYDDFIRTTEPRHESTVQRLVTQLMENGDVYLGDYEGMYCSRCETFLKESELNEAGQCPDHLIAPEKIKEKNYFFRLSKYQDWLLELLQGGFLKPEKRANELISLIKNEGLDDISISREGAEIGIAHPSDPNHKLYVWTEALMNYYTSIDRPELNHFWHGEVTHLVGKDITRFHCLIWPAMLHSLGLPLPKQVFAHGFFTINGQKMSKSLGNAVEPRALAQKYGADALRIALLSAFAFGNDGDFSEDHLAEVYRTKLAGGLGNLVNRVITLIDKYYNGDKSTLPVAPAVIHVEAFGKHMEALELYRACEVFFDLIDQTNKQLADAEPWKAPDKQAPEVLALFAGQLATLEALSDMAEVLLPEAAKRLKLMLGNAQKTGERVILFPQIEA